MIPAHANGRPDVAGCLAEPVRLIEGAVYRFLGLGEKPGAPLSEETRRRTGKTWAHPPAHYQLLAWGRHVRTWQDLACYVGLDGPDRGEVYFAPLSDFAAYFELVVDPPPPEKVVDHRVHGSGV